MSRLILKGDTQSNTGEFMPAPYIDYFYIKDTTYESVSSVFLSESDQTVASGSTYVINDEVALRNEAEGLNYYFLVWYEAEGADSNSDYTANRTLPQKIIEDGVDPLTAFHEESKSWGWTATTLFNTVPLSAADPYRIYDEQGLEYFKYTDASSATADVDWSVVNDMYVFAFSSTYLYSESTFESDWENSTLLRKNISDVSYEKIWENGSIADALEVEYVDADGSIYDRIPLQSIESNYYKINKMTHEEIVTYFEELVTEFRDTYNPDEDTYRRLYLMLNNISYVLTSYGSAVDLLPRLNMIRRGFAVKTPATPIGKLYKRFRKRIYTVNKAIINSERLYRKVMYNGKIVDLRSTTLPAASSPTYTGISDGCEYLYSSWAIDTNEVQLYLDDNEWTSGDIPLQATNGFFLFDYESAFRTTSNISQLYNMNLFANLGLNVPYGSFRLTKASLERKAESSAHALETNYPMPDITIYSEHVIMTSVMNDSKPYPQTDYVNFYEQGDSLYVNPGEEIGWQYVELTDTQYQISNDSYWPSHLMVRSYVDLGANSSRADNYRYVGFNFLDFRYMSNAETYDTSVTIQDKTLAVAQRITASCRVEYEPFADYVEQVEAACSYNYLINEFNTFFTEGILTEYEDRMEEAPWIRGPIAFLLHREMVYNIHSGDTSKIVEEAVNIISQINPINGNMVAIQQFASTFENFISTIYGSSPGEDGATFTTIANSLSDNIEWDYECGDRAIPSPDEMEVVVALGHEIVVDVDEEAAGTTEWVNSKINDAIEAGIRAGMIEEEMIREGITKALQVAETALGEAFHVVEEIYNLAMQGGSGPIYENGADEEFTNSYNHFAETLHGATSAIMDTFNVTSEATYQAGYTRIGDAVSLQNQYNTNLSEFTETTRIGVVDAVTQQNAAAHSRTGTATYDLNAVNNMASSFMNGLKSDSATQLAAMVTGVSDNILSNNAANQNLSMQTRTNASNIAVEGIEAESVMIDMVSKIM